MSASVTTAAERRWTWVLLGVALGIIGLPAVLALIGIFVAMGSS